MPKANLWGRTPVQKRKYDLASLEAAPRETMQASWVWYPWGSLGFTPQGTIRGPKLPNFPAVYRFRLGTDLVYIGETKSLGTRTRVHRQGVSRVRPYLRKALEQGDSVTIETMENILLKAARGYGLDNSLVRQSFEGMAILEARMSGLEVLNFNLPPE